MRRAEPLHGGLDDNANGPTTTARTAQRWRWREGLDNATRRAHRPREQSSDEAEGRMQTWGGAYFSSVEGKGIRRSVLH